MSITRRAKNESAYILLLCLLSGALYRIGGSDLKVPLKNKWRDWGCSLCAIIAMAVIIDAVWWVHCIYFFFSWLSLTSYQDHWGTEGVEWYEWLITGVGYSVAVIPYVWVSGQWAAFWVHAIIQIGSFMAVRCGSKNVYVEECGSGISIVLAKLAFMIGA